MFLQALSDVVRVVVGEDLIVHVLRALQALATVAGVLSLPEVTLATISAVCAFTNNIAGAPSDPPPDTPGQGANAAAGGGVGGAAGGDGDGSAAVVGAAAGAEAVAGGGLEVSREKSFSAMERVGAMSRPPMMCAQPPFAPPCLTTPPPHLYASLEGGWG